MCHFLVNRYCWRVIRRTAEASGIYIWLSRAAAQKWLHCPNGKCRDETASYLSSWNFTLRIAAVVQWRISIPAMSWNRPFSENLYLIKMVADAGRCSLLFRHAYKLRSSPRLFAFRDIYAAWYRILGKRKQKEFPFRITDWWLFSILNACFVRTCHSKCSQFKILLHAINEP